LKELGLGVTGAYQGAYQDSNLSARVLRRSTPINQTIAGPQGGQAVLTGTDTSEGTAITADLDIALADFAMSDGTILNGKLHVRVDLQGPNTDVASGTIVLSGSPGFSGPAVQGVHQAKATYKVTYGAPTSVLTQVDGVSSAEETVGFPVTLV